MIAIDRGFVVPRPPISVVVIGDTGEGLLIRSLLERLGAAVTLHLIGAPADFLLVVGQGRSAPPYLVVSGHGETTGLVFGDYAPEIDVSSLVDGRMGPAALSGRVDLPGTIVVSTACETGTPAFADAFLAGGAAGYIGPTGYPNGADAALFAHRFFHRVLSHRDTPRRALEAVRVDDDDSRMFVGSFKPARRAGRRRISTPNA